MLIQEEILKRSVKKKENQYRYSEWFDAEKDADTGHLFVH